MDTLDTQTTGCEALAASYADILSSGGPDIFPVLGFSNPVLASMRNALQSSSPEVEWLFTKGSSLLQAGLYDVLKASLPKVRWTDEGVQKMWTTMTSAATLNRLACISFHPFDLATIVPPWKVLLIALGALWRQKNHEISAYQWVSNAYGRSLRRLASSQGVDGESQTWSMINSKPASSAGEQKNDGSTPIAFEDSSFVSAALHYGSSQADIKAGYPNPLRPMSPHQHPAQEDGEPTSQQANVRRHSDLENNLPITSLQPHRSTSAPMACEACATVGWPDCHHVTQDVFQLSGPTYSPPLADITNSLIPNLMYIEPAHKPRVLGWTPPEEKSKPIAAHVPKRRSKKENAPKSASVRNAKDSRNAGSSTYLRAAAIRNSRTKHHHTPANYGTSYRN